jgi:hypothetical protein
MKREIKTYLQAVIKSYSKIALLLTYLVALGLVMSISILAAEDNHYLNNPAHNKDEKVITQEDSLRNVLLNDYHRYKLKNQTRLSNLNWLKQDFNLIKSFNSSTLAQNEVYEISQELYHKYYKNKIELYNYKNMAYLYLDLKEAQSNQGAVQFQIPLPNFNSLFQKKPKPKD